MLTDDKLSLWTLTCIIFAALRGSMSIQISRISVPRYVENGTKDFVILDCDYAYNPDKDKNIVVKWFLNNDPEPIYQWITEYDYRSVSWRLKGYIDMNYVPSPSTPYNKFRALKIKRPTIELSGKYSCNVVSLASQDDAANVMVVFAPPRQVTFNYTKTTSHSANLSCQADGVFPIPEFHLYQITERDSDWQPLTGVPSSSLRDDGTYDAESYVEIHDRALPSSEAVSYKCVLKLPGTEFSVGRTLVYYPGPPEVNCASNSWSQIAYIIVIKFIFHIYYNFGN